jgi:hypothetical protein
MYHPKAECEQARRSAEAITVKGSYLSDYNPTFPLRRARVLIFPVLPMTVGILTGLVFLPVAAHAAPNLVTPAC